MSMYQDADTPQLDIFNGVTEADGSQCTPTRLWIDLFHALDTAEKVIYITGWSVFTGISLVRGKRLQTMETPMLENFLRGKHPKV